MCLAHYHYLCTLARNLWPLCRYASCMYFMIFNIISWIFSWWQQCVSNDVARLICLKSAQGLTFSQLMFKSKVAVYHQLSTRMHVHAHTHTHTTTTNTSSNNNTKQTKLLQPNTTQPSNNNKILLPSFHAPSVPGAQDTSAHLTAKEMRTDYWSSGTSHLFLMASFMK